MILCELETNGQTITGTAESLTSGKTTVLSNVSISWGRKSAFDQPTPATARAIIALDKSDPATAARIFEVGRTLTITARYAAAAPAAPITLHADSSRKTLHPPTPGAAITSTIPPAPYSDHPEAWDNLPRIEFGNIVTGSIRVTIPPGSRLRIRAVYYSAPFATTATIGETLVDTRTSGTHTWEYVPDQRHAGAWLGLRLDVDPVGHSWDNTPNTWSAYPITWDSLNVVHQSALNVTRSAGLTHTAIVFTGRITDAPLSWNDEAGRAQVDLTAVDISAELSNRRIGSQPWPAETLSARIDRVLRESRLPLRAVFSTPAAARITAAKDVDSKPVLSLIKDIATAAGCILWLAAHSTIGAYIRLEDPSRRDALYRLDLPPTGGARLAPAATAATPIPADEIMRDSVEVNQDLADIASSVSVKWQETQGDKTTEHTETAQDPARLRAYGYRNISINTELTDPAAARELAQQTLNRAAPGGYIIPSATWKPRHSDPANVLKALDATNRLGMPVVITDVPDWIPGAPAIPAYIDGGHYTYTRGRWTLDLSLTRPAAAGNSITWQQTPPAMTWQRTPLSWLDLSTATI